MQRSRCGRPATGRRPARGLGPGEGELHLSRPITGIYWTPDYILEPQLSFEGRKAYNARLGEILKAAYAVGCQFEAKDKMARLQTALLNALMMVRTAISTQQWEEQLKKNKPTNQAGSNVRRMKM